MQYTLCKTRGIYTLLLSSSEAETPFRLDDIARTIKAAHAIGSLFADHLVLPCHAAEIMDDLLGGGEFL